MFSQASKMKGKKIATKKKKNFVVIFCTLAKTQRHGIVKKEHILGSSV
jgi:hypothetical protein